MTVHQPDIPALNEFFKNGFTLLAELEKSAGEHKEQNLKAFRESLCNAWMSAAHAISNPLITIDNEPVA